MRGWRKRSGRRVVGAIGTLVLVGFAIALVSGATSDADRDDAPAAGTAAAVRSQGCGAASAATVAAVDEQVAKQIYEDELAGRETLEDEAHVRQSRPLLNALSSGDTPAIAAAVSAIVYTPHWHIVRLRVLRAGHVVADVGGPYVIAPVTGTIQEHGRTLGSFVMSVQDDSGYVKLVTRLIGIPVELYRGRSPLMGTVTPVPQVPRAEAHLEVHGTAYRARVFTTNSFPDGTLTVALLVPLPPPSLSSVGCGQLRADSWGSVAMHIQARLALHAGSWGELVRVVRATSGAAVFVRSGGHELAGGAPPRHLPSEGSVRIDGQTRWVFSWLAARGVRVYVVAPAA
ncbi:MAG TPA: hypothetical protein VMB91_09660 [Solirubrobacteraceae bacterium]|nr:hypothetical protein [Solirubrobacteraceae bacterium]